MTIGIVLFAAILVLSQGNIGSFNGRGGRRSRRRRVAVCRERAPSPTRTTPVEVVTTVPPVAPPGHPPTPDELEAALQAVEPAFRRCAAPGSGTLIIDAAVDGASGRMRDFGMRGDAAPHTNPPCLAAVLAQLQFAPFDGEIEVHWALTY